MQYIDCFINPISRQVSYPGAVIVQRDTHVEALRFHFSLQAEHALEDDSIRVMVKTSKEIRGFNAENVRVETNDGGDEELVFEHTITRYETEVPGQINVSVCGNQISGDTITEAWHTLNMSFQVASSVHTDSDEGEDSEETKASNAEKIAALQTLVDAITSGRPIPVDLKSKMVDTGAIYLYTGNETGEQHNYWYYYDGTTWVAGSEYGGMTIDDELSSTSENAVQNKVIKANFDEVNGRLDEQGEIVDRLNEGGLDIKDDVIEAQITEWLNDHPEATTIVQDGAISEVKLASALKPKIINAYVTPEMFGAKGDGTTDDTAAIQSAINAALSEHVSFKMSPKTYAVSSTLNVLTPNEAQEDAFFDFGGATIKATASMVAVIKVATSESGFGSDVSKNTRVIYGLIIDCNELSDYGVYHKMGRNLWYQNCTILNAKVCAFYADGQTQIDKMFIDRRMYNYNATGIQLNATDNKINNVRMRDAKIGVVVNGGSTFLNGVHCWLINSVTLPGSRYIVVNSGNLHMSNCYADTYETAFVMNADSPAFFSNCKVYVNPDFYNDDIYTSVPVVFDTDGGNLQTILNNDVKMFGFNIDGNPYYTRTDKKIQLAKDISADELFGQNWNVFSSANKLLNSAEIDGVPSTATRGAIVLRNLYTLSNAMPLLRSPEMPRITIEGSNEISVVTNDVRNNGFAASGFLRINITSQTQDVLLSGLPYPTKTYHVLGCSTGTTQNVPNKIVHFAVNTSGKLSVFGYSASYPLSGEFIIPINYNVLTR